MKIYWHKEKKNKKKIHKEKERIKWVEGYENIYAISSTGRILRAYKHNKFKEIGWTAHGTKYISINGKAISIRYLVAKAFIPNPNNYLYVNTIDGNGLNANYKNLYWSNEKIQNKKLVN